MALGKGALKELQRLFRQCDVDSSGFIEKDELNAVIRGAGVKQTRGEFLETLEALDPSRDNRISFTEFRAFFKAKVLAGNNSKYNRLMVKPVIGRSKTSSYDLPGGYHTYGQKVERDQEGSKEVILTWKPFKAKKTEEKNLNIVKMNKRAIQNNCLTAQQMTDFNRQNPIFDTKVVKSRTSTLSTRDKLGGRKTLANGDPFGITKKAGTPIRDLVCGKYNDDYDESRGEPFYPQNNASVNRTKRKINKKTFDGTRPTKASLGHGRNAYCISHETPKPPFKMERFKNVKARVHSIRALREAGRSVIDREETPES